MRLEWIILTETRTQSVRSRAENTRMAGTYLEMDQFSPPTAPLESEEEICSPPSPPRSSPPIDIPDQEPRPLSPRINHLDERVPSPHDFETSDLGEEDDYLGRNTPPPSDPDEDDPPSDQDDPPPNEDSPPPNEDVPPNEDGPPSTRDDLPPPDSAEAVPVTLEDMKTNMEFVEMLKEATLESQFSPSELDEFRNPQEISFSPSEDPDLLLSILNYIANLNASQDVYNKNRLNIQRRFPEAKVLSFDQAKRMVSKLSGVVTWKHDMCVDSCTGFTGPYEHLEECPKCSKPRYDPDELKKSNGKIKKPQKSFTTFPLGPQLQSRWKSPGMAEKMHYRRTKTKDVLRNRDLDEFVWDDILRPCRLSPGDLWVSCTMCAVLASIIFCTNRTA